ncbi:unnamed protein product [Cuscuta europaea]|uniref:Uncharacterized protein n=1 Tax=Cuscuta europaea TaxID=41803 RepID=A0A9P1EDD5_CUSEU|nr:unnamed protein product [Cuscuta europaea]
MYTRFLNDVTLLLQQTGEIRDLSDQAHHRSAAHRRSSTPSSTTNDIDLARNQQQKISPANRGSSDLLLPLTLGVVRNQSNLSFLDGAPDKSSEFWIKKISSNFASVKHLSAASTNFRPATSRALLPMNFPCNAPKEKKRTVKKKSYQLLTLLPEISVAMGLEINGARMIMQTAGVIFI